MDNFIYNTFAFLEKLNLARRETNTVYLGHGDFDGERYWEVKVGRFRVRYDIDRKVFF